MKKQLVKAIFLPLLLAALPAFAATDHGRHDHGSADHVIAGTATEAGIKATLKVNRAHSMVDLFLVDAATGAPVTSGKATAYIKLPNGKTMEKELICMKMGEQYLIMNSLDSHLIARYVFNVYVASGSKQTKFG